MSVPSFSGAAFTTVIDLFGERLVAAFPFNQQPPALTDDGAWLFAINAGHHLTALDTATSDLLAVDLTGSDAVAALAAHTK